MLGPEDATRPEFWVNQLVEPVLFHDTLSELPVADPIVVECGPAALGGLVRRHPAVGGAGHPVVELLAPRPERHVLDPVGELWAHGIDREWYPFLLGGSMAAYWNDLVVRPDLPPADRDRATADLLAAFGRERGPADARPGRPVRSGDPAPSAARAPARRLPIFCAGLVLLGAGFGLLGIAHQLGTYIVAVVIWTIGETAVVSAGQAIVIDLAPPDLQGRYSGVYGAAWGGAAAVIGPAAGTWLLGLGSGALWAACAVACAAVAAGQWAIGGEIRRRAAPDARLTNRSSRAFAPARP